MSLSRALSNAVSGLAATSRGTETVSANLANAQTKGYARRELQTSPQTIGANLGGVRIDGITRVVNESVLAEYRLASAGQAYGARHVEFARDMESLIGVPGEASSLGAMMTGFRSAIVDATSRPDDELRLVNVVDSAARLADRFNQIGDSIQAQRGRADQDISAMVQQLNADVSRVAVLNHRIAAFSANGTDVSSLYDERQAVIDRISEIVPVNVIQRQGGHVALFTTSGAVLLDGREPVEISFQGTQEFVAGMEVGVGPVHRIVYGDTELTAGQMRLFSGGDLEAAFEIRDKMAPELQSQIDALAMELSVRLSDPVVDGTLPAGAAGLFTDQGNPADMANLDGLSSRLSLNTAVDPEAGGEAWRIRDGLMAAAPGNVGDGALLSRMGEALTADRIPVAAAAGTSRSNLAGLAGEVEAHTATRRVNAEGDLAVKNAHASAFHARLLDDGVDSDAEMQRLLEYEQAYAANARVIRAVDEMMDAILRI